MRGVKRTPELKAFLKRLEPFEDLRHSVQHLNGTIETWGDKGEPTWGSIAWIHVDELEPVFRFRSFVVVAGSVRKTTRPAVNPLGQQFEPTVDLIELTAFERTASLSAAFRSLGDFAVLFERALEAAFSAERGISGETRAADLIVAVSAVSDEPASAASMTARRDSA
jgi:hypothetical protein